MDNLNNLAEQFTHLHLHTKYSLQDSTIKPNELAKVLKTLGMKKCAVTEHGVMYNMPEIYSAFEKEGIELIIGLEAYVAPRTNKEREAHIDNANYHLVLLCKNYKGYENLLKIASNAAVEGMYYKPRTDKRFLRKHNEGLVCLSACLGGEIAQLLMNGKYNEAKEVALEYEEIFGKGNYYLEIQDHGLEEQIKINPLIVKLSRETGIPLVATNDCHYIKKEDWEAHDILMAIQADVPVSSTKRKVYTTKEFYVKTGEEMTQLFSMYPEAIANTKKIADMCHVELEFGGNKLPEFKIPSDFEGTNTDFLRHVCFENAKYIYPTPLSDEVVERLNYEIDVVHSMGYTNYFLITWDFFRFCRYGTFDINDEPDPNWEPIETGPGRGSGAGSVMLYTLGITRIDPLKYNLMFERFLDPSRVSMPDIDSDFEDERRHEVIEYVVKKYGRNCTAQVIAFQTMAARSVIRRVGKSLEYSYGECDKLAKMVPKEVDITLASAIQKSPEFAKAYTVPRNKKLIDIAMKLEGLPFSTTTHAAGVLITNSDGIEANVPVWVNDKAIVSQYDKDWLEQLGLLKMDFLGLKTLGVLKRCFRAVYKNHNVKLNLDDLYRIPDPKPFSFIGSGKTMGIFQLEGTGMTQFMKELKAENLEQVIAGISLYRPGPMGEIPNFLKNKRNPNDIEYAFPELESILKETYGILTYQEQCMRAVIAIAGYHKSDSDGFRRVVAKKKKKLMPLHRQWFIKGRKLKDYDVDGRLVDYDHEIPGGVAKGYSEEELSAFFDTMKQFGSYAFNKSHAACYAVVAYCTAYCMYYYPCEFMAELLNSVLGNNDRISRYISYCKKELGINIVPPDINKSSANFVANSGNELTIGLLVKTAKSNVVDEIIRRREEEGKYKDMKDFFMRTYDILDKSTFEALVSCGAFDSLGAKRSIWLIVLEDVWNGLSKIKNSLKTAERSGRKVNLEEKFEDKVFSQLFDVNELPMDILLRLEKKFVGFYLTGNPLNDYAYSIKTSSNFKLSQLDYSIDNDGNIVMDDITVKDRQKVSFICIVDNITKFATKTTKQIMARFKLEDFESSSEALMFAQDFARNEEKLRDGEVYRIDGSIQMGADSPPIIIVRDVSKVEDVVSDRITIDTFDVDAARRVVNFMAHSRFTLGDTPVYLRHNGVSVLLSRKYWLSVDNIDLIKDEFKDNIEIKISRW